MGRVKEKRPRARSPKRRSGNLDTSIATVLHQAKDSSQWRKVVEEKLKREREGKPQ